MYRKDIKVGILYMEGTNCDEELYSGFSMSGVSVSLLPIKSLNNNSNIFDYQILIIPGGFSAGDYVRAGAIFSVRLKYSLGTKLTDFVRNGFILGGICNGFQTLVEMGFLPGSVINERNAALYTNNSSLFECRTTFLKPGNKKAPITRYLDKDRLYQIPCAHAEGKLVFKDQKTLEEVEGNDMVIFRYSSPSGTTAYPWNPNGSANDIAGICSREFNIFGMMPHPERALFSYNHEDWSLHRKKDMHGDGWYLINSMIKFVEKKF